MKFNFKKAMMPLAVVVLGAAAAFATNAAKQSSKADATMIGYFYDHSRPVGQKCQPINVDCNTIGGEICTNLDETVQYWQTDQETGLSCTGLLFKNN